MRECDEGPPAGSAMVFTTYEHRGPDGSELWAVEHDGCRVLRERFVRMVAVTRPLPMILRAASRR